MLWILLIVLVQETQENFTSDLLDRAYVLGYVDLDYSDKGQIKQNPVLFHKVQREMQPLLAWTDPVSGDEVSYFSEFFHLVRHPKTGQIAFIGRHRVLNGGETGLYVLDPDGTLTLYGKLNSDLIQSKLVRTAVNNAAMHQHAESVVCTWDFTDSSFNQVDECAVERPVLKSKPLDRDRWARTIGEIYLRLIWSPNPGELLIYTSSDFIKIHTEKKTGMAVDLSGYRPALDELKNHLYVSMPARLGDHVFVYTPQVVFRADWDGRLKPVFAHKGRWIDRFSVVGDGAYFVIGKYVYGPDGAQLLKLPKRTTPVHINAADGRCVYAARPKIVACVDLNAGTKLIEQRIKMRIEDLKLSRNGTRLFVFSRKTSLDDERAADTVMSQFVLTTEGLSVIGRPVKATRVFTSPVGAFFETPNTLRCMDDQGMTCDADLPLKEGMVFTVLVDGEVLYSGIPFTDNHQISSIIQMRANSTQMHRDFLRHMGQ